MLEKINTALVHDWLVSMRGGEKVLAVLCDKFPRAPLYTLVYRKGALTPSIENRKIITSFLQHVPGAAKYYQYFLPLMPLAIEGMNAKGYDLVISSSHAVAKGLAVGKNAVHICYCHTPMRYIWDQFDDYFNPARASFAKRSAMKVFVNYLRRWDIESAENVDHFLANSSAVRGRIKRIYNREAEVIHPPVDVDRFKPSYRNDGYYLIISALVPYKRIDLAVKAFNKNGEKLVIIGSGSEENKLRSMANPGNIRFLGWQSDQEVIKYYGSCRGLIFPGEEDFGIVPVEAMASGKPVVAFGKGGALDSMIAGKTGLFFEEQDPDSLSEAVLKLSRMSFDPDFLHQHSMKFGRDLFERKLIDYVQARLIDSLKKRP